MLYTAVSRAQYASQVYLIDNTETAKYDGKIYRIVSHSKTFKTELSSNCCKRVLLLPSSRLALDTHRLAAAHQKEPTTPLRPET
jgi:hypothetical protein